MQGTTILLVAFSGALGCLSRYALVGTVQRAIGPVFPAGTMLVNVTGSLLIGLVMAIFAARGQEGSPARIALTAGFLGGFTTFSSFSFEAWSLFEKRQFGASLLYFALTNALSLGGCAAGVLFGRFVTR
ncbi:MAG: CrcB family protein [Deltaproteobacteria bacterium]|nr:CrcB family protein [Deltaproteobacteria bacterium]